MIMDLKDIWCKYLHRIAHTWCMIKWYQWLVLDQNKALVGDWWLIRLNHWLVLDQIKVLVGDLCLSKLKHW